MDMNLQCKGLIYILRHSLTWQTSLNNSVPLTRIKLKYVRGVLQLKVFVCVCFAGTRLLLRDTSLMPDIPGLPALVTMLFTPIMELRLVRHTYFYFFS